jgi:hypothetical protein
MRSTQTISVIIFALTSTACTQQYLPEFDLPAPMTIAAGQPAIGPRLVQTADETLNLSWMERKKDGALLRFSSYRDGDWQEPVDVVEDADMFVSRADLPGVYAIGTDSLLAYWLSYTSDGTYSYQVLTAQSSDHGETWSAPSSPHKDGTDTEHGFVSTYPSSSGTGLIWLDGRDGEESGMTLRSAVVDSDGALTKEALIDDLVCDCCQTDIAVSSQGPVAVYRNRTKEEIRDINIARNLDGQWQVGTPLSNDGWKIDGCPVNGPSIAASDDLVVVAWFTGANNEPLVKTAVSTNAGKTFSEPVIVSSNAPMGRVGIATIEKSTYAVSWLEPDQDETLAVRIRALTADGQMGRVITVGRTADARAVPQMIRAGDKLVLAWTDDFNDMSKVVSVRVPILGFYD